MTLTKDYLEYLGITEITEDGTIHTKSGTLKPRQNCGGKYQRINLCIPGGKGKAQDLLVHKVVYTWFKGIIPAGMEIHHIDFDPTNNSKDNLECLTHEEHLKRHGSTKEIKCRLDIPREWYEKKASLATTYQSKYTYECKIRYWDSHIEERQKLMKLKRDIEIIKYLKKHYREIGDTRNWHQFRQLEVNWESYDEELREKLMTAITKRKI